MKRVTSDVGPFAIIPEWILRADISHRALRLFGLLSRYADRDDTAFPSRSTLADALKESVDSVDRAIRELVSIGALAVEHRHDDDRQTSNLYRLRYAAPHCEEGAAGLRPSSRTDAALLSRADAAPPTAGLRHRTRTTGTRTIVNESTDSSEPPQNGASTPPVLMFPCVGNGGQSWGLTDEQVTKWQAVYTNLHVFAECRKALLWLEANPVKRKTTRGMSNFLLRWLNRATDRGGSSQLSPATQARRPGQTGPPPPGKYDHLTRRPGQTGPAPPGTAGRSARAAATTSTMTAHQHVERQDDHETGPYRAVVTGNGVGGSAEVTEERR